ncbi:MAG: hypothetical protein J5I41_09190 [Saprospiraceae bacterium]|nr:hypothetical protein [Saprospiraceae bacterium]
MQYFTTGFSRFLTLVLVCAFAWTTRAQSNDCPVPVIVNESIQAPVGYEILDLQDNVLLLVSEGGQPSACGLTPGQTYRMRVFRSGHDANDITTYDILRLVRRIAGHGAGEERDRQLAGDFNASGNASMADALGMRHQVLHPPLALPEGLRTWSFADAEVVENGKSLLQNGIFVFSGPGQELPFYAVKRGRTRPSAFDYDQMVIQDTLFFEVSDFPVGKGEVFEVGLRASALPPLTGLQMALVSPGEQVRFLDPDPGQPLPPHGHFVGDRGINGGRLTLSWIWPNALLPGGLSLADGQDMLRVRFRALKDGMVHDAFAIDPLFMRAEAYDDKDRFYHIALKFVPAPYEGPSFPQEQDGETTKEGQFLPPAQSANTRFDGMSGLRVWPHPVNEDTRIRFDLQEAGPVAITLRDMTGRPVAERRLAWAEQGLQQVAIPEAGTWVPGVYTLELRSRQGMQTLLLVR